MLVYPITTGLTLATGADVTVTGAGVTPNDSELINFLRSYYRNDPLKLLEGELLLLLVSVVMVDVWSVLPNKLSIIVDVITWSNVGIYVGRFWNKFTWYISGNYCKT